MQQKIDYFIARTEKDIDELKQSQDKLHEKVDTILEFKWQIIGGATAIAALVSLAISLASIIASK